MGRLLFCCPCHEISRLAHFGTDQLLLALIFPWVMNQCFNTLGYCSMGSIDIWRWSEAQRLKRCDNKNKEESISLTVNKYLSKFFFFFIFRFRIYSVYVAYLAMNIGSTVSVIWNLAFFHFLYVYRKQMFLNTLPLKQLSNGKDSQERKTSWNFEALKQLKWCICSLP